LFLCGNVPNQLAAGIASRSAVWIPGVATVVHKQVGDSNAPHAFPGFVCVKSQLVRLKSVVFYCVVRSVLRMIVLVKLVDKTKKTHTHKMLDRVHVRDWIACFPKFCCVTCGA
jgi:hypothetical protein